MKIALFAAGALVLPFAASAAIVLGLMAGAAPAAVPLQLSPSLLYGAGMVLLAPFAACIAGLQRAYSARMPRRDDAHAD